MIVLGIDPGTAALGYGIVESSRGRLRAIDHGCLVTSADTSLPERLLAIHALVDELIAVHEPALLAIERLFFSKNAQTAFGVGQARGVVLLAAAQHQVPVVEATPNEVKSAVAGYGAADKEQVQRMVQLVLDMAELPRPDDAADALAVAVWGVNSAREGRVGPPVAGHGSGRGRADRAGRIGYERAVRAALAHEASVARAAKRNASKLPTTGRPLSVTRHHPRIERRLGDRPITPPRIVVGDPHAPNGERLAGVSRVDPRADSQSPSAASGHDVDRLCRGEGGAISADSLVIEVGGIGYRVFTPPSVWRRPRRAARSSSIPSTSSARISRRCTGSGRPRSSGSSTCC